MIVLNKREGDTLREISRWRVFYANWRPKTRIRLERLALVENVSPAGADENYQLTDKGRALLDEMMAFGVQS